jgi:hypothetical protein
MTIATTLLLVLTLLFYVADGFRRFKNIKMDQVALKNGYFVSTLIATFIFFALMGTNVGMFYEKWRMTGGSQTTTIVYTPLNITTSVIISMITIILLILLH